MRRLSDASERSEPNAGMANAADEPLIRDGKVVYQAESHSLVAGVFSKVFEHPNITRYDLS